MANIGDRVTTLEVEMKHTKESLNKGEDRMKKLEHLSYQNAETYQRVIDMQEANEARISDLVNNVKEIIEDTNEVVTLHKTAKNLKGWLLATILPVMAGFLYLKEHWKDFFS